MHQEFAVITLMVKNEEQCICKTLQPFISTGYKDFYIYDTGSDDDTVDVVTEFLEKNETRFIIKQEPFIDFAQSRNKLIEYVNRDFSDKRFFLMLDAEWYFVNPGNLAKYLAEMYVPENKCCGFMLHHGDLIFPHSRIFPIGTTVRFYGPVHEYCSDVHGIIPGDAYAIYKPTMEGKTRTKQRFERDLTLIQDFLQTHENEPRYTFYLAQTLQGLDRVDEAITEYKKRFNLPCGDPEERYIAALRAGRFCLGIAGREPEGVDLLLKGWSSRPTRVECLVDVAVYYRGRDMHLKYHFAKTACSIKISPKDTLFIEHDKINHKRFEEWSIGAWYVGEYVEGLTALIVAIRSGLNPLQLEILRRYYKGVERELYNRYMSTFDKKILNLIPYSEEHDMKNVLEPYLISNEINYYFYKYKENLETEYLIEGRIIYIKGNESRIPGNLDKMIKTFNIIKNTDYDYVVKSNIATVVNFRALKFCLERNIDYGGPLYYPCSRIVLNDGLTEEFNKQYGEYGFVSSECIVMSKKCVNFLLKNQKKLKKSEVIDDVAIGVCINSNFSSGLLTKSYGYPEGIKAVDINHKDKNFLAYRHANHLLMNETINLLNEHLF